MDWTRVKWSEAGQITRLLGMKDDGRDMAPAHYFAKLVDSGRLADAVNFLATALPRFESVTWAARTVRGLSDPDGDGCAEEIALKTALLWLQDPVESRRRAAFDAAAAAKPNSAERMAALAVFYSGGSVAPPDCHPLQAPREAAGRFSAGAILLAAARARDTEQALRKALASGVAFATQQEAL